MSAERPSDRIERVPAPIAPPAARTEHDSVRTVRESARTDSRPDVRPTILFSVDLEEWSDARLAGIPPTMGAAPPPLQGSPRAAPLDERSASFGSRPARREARTALSAGRPASFEGAVETLAAILDDTGARATFFTLGRVARRYPRLVRSLARRHEIASHGDSHTDLRRLGPHGFADELRRSRALLQDLTGQDVAGYRSPGWSLGACAEWAIPLLEREGFGYDSSIVPGRGLLFVPGRPSAPRAPHRVGEKLWELPPAALILPGLSCPAGGAFLRLAPLAWTRAIVRSYVRTGEAPVLHVHPWELGRTEGIEVSPWRHALLFAGAPRLEDKLRALLTDHRATALETAWRALAASGAGVDALATARSAAGGSCGERADSATASAAANPGFAAAGRVA